MIYSPTRADRERVDNAILDHLKRGPADNWGCRKAVRRQFPDVEFYSMTSIMDKALQRLRKAGKIEFSGKPRRWRVAGAGHARG